MDNFSDLKSIKYFVTSVVSRLYVSSVVYIFVTVSSPPDFLNINLSSEIQF